MWSNSSLAMWLVEAGANVNASDEAGRTPLIVAINLGDETMAKYLIKKGADPNIQDDEGWSAKDWAIFWELEDLVKFMEEYSQNDL